MKTSLLLIALATLTAMPSCEREKPNTGKAKDGINDADNAARNKDDKAPTPMDQGNSKADIDTTAQIRKEVMALDDLSLTAKNVKIITKEGKVALRGPVNTAAEKQSICEIADRIAKAENVDNQLEVKPASDSKE